MTREEAYKIVQKEALEAFSSNGNFRENMRKHLSEEEINFSKSFNLLTLKPLIYVANLSESEIKNHQTAGVRCLHKARIKTEGILCVFRGLYNAALRRQIRRSPASCFKHMPNKKGAGRILSFTPLQLLFAFARLFRYCFIQGLCIRQTEPCGP